MMNDGEGRRGSKRFNRMSGSDSSSREGSPQPKRPKRSFSPTSDDGDLVVPAVGEYIDDTPPPEGQPIVRQAVAFSWDKSVATSVPTYSASVPAKPAVNYFLPGQAPIITPTSQFHSAPTSAQRSPSPSCPPSPPTRRKTSSSRKKKSEGKTRHFNDEFSSQTGRFKVGPGFVHDPKAVEPPPVNHGSGPYSSMYRMGAGSPSTPMTSLASMSSAPPQAAQNSHQAAYTGYPPMGTTSHHSSSALPSRSAPSSNMATPASQHKASGSKSSRHRSSTKQQGTTSGQTEQTSQKSEVNPRYYRRDYERDQNLHASSKEKQKASRSSQGRSKESAPSTPRSRSQPQDSASPALSTATLHTNPGDSQASSPDRTAQADHKRQGPAQQLRMVTILIEDIRSGVTDHQLAEVRVPLYERPDRFWADGRDVCEALQGSPSRIDGPARVYTLRGKYRQFFLRVSPDNVDEINSSNLQITLDRTLDIVVEPLPQQGVLPQPPQIPPELLSPGSDSETMGSSAALQPHPYHGMSSDETLRQLNRTIPHKRRRSISPLNTPNQQQFAHISPHASPSPSQTSILLPPQTKKRSSYDYSRMSPRSAQYYQSYARNYNIPFPASPNTPGRIASSQEEVDAAIVFFIKPLVEEDPKWMKYMESKAKPPRVSEVLKQYHFVQGKVDELCGTRTPIHWDGAPNLQVQKEHVWQVLNLESPWGPDCQETLSLLRLYGPDGQRYEDSRILDLISDASIPTGKPYKRFLKLLRQIDQDWLKDNPEDAESDGSTGSTDSRSTS